MLWLFPLLVMAEMGWLSADDFEQNQRLVAEHDQSGVVDAVFIRENDLNESSGLAVSRVRPGYFWSHNDSGGKAWLYAFDRRGQSTGQARLSSAKSDDWEDMASYIDEGIPRLLVADCGDNLKRRTHISLFLFDEPDPQQETSLKNYHTLSVTYPDGARDCEAVAVDSQARQVFLISKNKLPWAAVYTVPLPSRRDEMMKTKTSLVAKRVLTLPMSLVTSMDINPANGELWIASYFQAFRFSRSAPDQSLAQQLGRVPFAVELPRWAQIEAVAVDQAGDLWVTSEGAPAKLGRLPQPSHGKRTVRNP